MPLLPNTITITNTYHGSPIAKIVFAAMTILTLGRSLAHIVLPDGGAQSIATIPLATYPTSVSSAIVGMFAQWGLSQLMMGLMYVVVLFRYRSLIPLMWLFLLLECTGRIGLGYCKPTIETTGTAPGAAANVMFPILASSMLKLLLTGEGKKGK